MNTEKPPLDWSKPLQTTDGVKAELKCTIKNNNYSCKRVVTISDKDVLLDESGGQGYLGIQIINTPETKLVSFSVNYYCDINFFGLHYLKEEAESNKGLDRTNRIDFSMQLEPGKNYEVTGVKEVQ